MTLLGKRQLVGAAAARLTLAAALLAVASGTAPAQQGAAKPKPPAVKPLAKAGKAGKAGRKEVSEKSFYGAILVDVQGNQFRDPLRLTKFIEEIRRTPFRDIVVQVRAYGDAYYDSAIVPRAYGVAEMANEREKFDPLAMFIAEMKKDEGRRVIVWIDALRVANANRAVPEAATHVTKTHPDWLTRNSAMKTEDKEGNSWLDPGVEQVQEHLSQVVAELVGKYPVAGVAIDGLRYPGLDADWGYNTAMLDAWRATSGQQNPPAPKDEAWTNMRQKQVDQCLTRMAKAAKAARPDVVVAAFALAEGTAPLSAEDFPKSDPARGAMQNWAFWMQNKTVDLIYLQNFRNETEGGTAFNAWNALAALLTQQTQVETVPFVAGSANISLDVMAQMRRVYEGGFVAAGLSNQREPIQDSASRELFFRALGNKLLANDAERLPFPSEAGAAPPLPGAVVASAAPQATPPPAGAAPPAPAPAEVTDKTPEPPPPGPAPENIGNLDDLIKRSPAAPDPKELMKPSQEAMTFLQKMFKNIFN